MGAMTNSNKPNDGPFRPRTALQKMHSTAQMTQFSHNSSSSTSSTPMTPYSNTSSNIFSNNSSDSISSNLMTQSSKRYKQRKSNAVSIQSPISQNSKYNISATPFSKAKHKKSTSLTPAINGMKIQKNTNKTAKKKEAKTKKSKMRNHTSINAKYLDQALITFHKYFPVDPD